MADRLLILNAGSSSLKFAIYRQAGDPATDPELLGRGQIAGIGRAPEFQAKDARGDALPAPGDLGGIGDHAAALALLQSWLAGSPIGGALAGAGHRVVHGGDRFTRPLRLDDKALALLTELEPLAPHHQPHNLAAIRALAAQQPDLPQIACFDTAFHATQEPEAKRLGLPLAMEAQGLRRYGFHGLSYEFVVGRLTELLGQVPERLIVAHLGNGASLAAIRDGRSIATTMGFSTLDGLVMGTRVGSLDPGALLHLWRQGWSLKEVEDLLYNKSGLLGLSGISADMRRLLDLEPNAPGAALAIRQYVYAICRQVGGLAAALGGLDALAFTGGVGENAGPIRARIADKLGWLGATLDEAADRKGLAKISAAQSRVAIYVLPTDEERVIARHTARLLTS